MQDAIETDAGNIFSRVENIRYINSAIVKPKEPSTWRFREKHLSTAYRFRTLHTRERVQLHPQQHPLMEARGFSSFLFRLSSDAVKMRVSVTDDVSHFYNAVFRNSSGKEALLAATERILECARCRRNIHIYLLFFFLPLTRRYSVLSCTLCGLTPVTFERVTRG